MGRLLPDALGVAQRCLPASPATKDPAPATAQEPQAAAIVPPSTSALAPGWWRGPGLLIKGNISSNGNKIYHTPSSPWYAQTEVDAARGERWFCSEAEALAAGWRAPGR